MVTRQVARRGTLTLDVEVDGTDCRVTHRQGTLEAKLYGEEWRIESIGVTKGYRGRGIGSALLDAFLRYVDQEFEGERARMIDLHVGLGGIEGGALPRAGLIAWYERHGFVYQTNQPSGTHYMIRKGRD